MISGLVHSLNFNERIQCLVNRWKVTWELKSSVVLGIGCQWCQSKVFLWIMSTSSFLGFANVNKLSWAFKNSFWVFQTFVKLSRAFQNSFLGLAMFMKLSCHQNNKPPQKIPSYDSRENYNVFDAHQKLPQICVNLYTLQTACMNGLNMKAFCVQKN